MEDRRKEKRTSIIPGLAVEDEYERVHLGSLVDISPKGLRIRGEVPVEVNDELRLAIHLKERILGKKNIHVTAVCVWSRQDEGEERWQSGFEFYRVTQEAASLVLGLILETNRAN